MGNLVRDERKVERALEGLTSQRFSSKEECIFTTTSLDESVPSRILGRSGSFQYLKKREGIVMDRTKRDDSLSLFD